MRAPGLAGSLGAGEGVAGLAGESDFGLTPRAEDGCVVVALGGFDCKGAAGRGAPGAFGDLDVAVVRGLAIFSP